MGAIPSSLHRTPCASVPGCLGCSGLPGEPAPRERCSVLGALRGARLLPTASSTPRSRAAAAADSTSRARRAAMRMATVEVSPDPPSVWPESATIATTAGASSGTHAHKYQAHVPKLPSNKKKRNSQAGGDGGGGSMIPALQAASHGGLSSPADGPHGGRSRGARTSTWLSPLL